MSSSTPAPGLDHAQRAVCPATRSVSQFQRNESDQILSRLPVTSSGQWRGFPSITRFSQHYLAWSQEFMIATVPQADKPVVPCCWQNQRSSGPF